MRRTSTLPLFAAALALAALAALRPAGSGSTRAAAGSADVGPPAREASAAELRDLRELALTADDATTVGYALAELGRFGALADDHALVSLLQDPRLRVRQDLVFALCARKSPRAIAVLQQVATGTDADLRPLALQALGRMGGPEATAALTALQAHGGWNDVERTSLREALVHAARPDQDR